MTARLKHILITTAVLLGLSLIVGATNNLPTSAQGIVTGRSQILITQLANQVGERELLVAVLASGQIAPDQRPVVNNDRRQRRDRAANRRRGNRQSTTRPGRGRERLQLDDDRADQLARLGPERVYQIAVDAGLITQAEAASMLTQ